MCDCMMGRWNLRKEGIWCGDGRREEKREGWGEGEGCGHWLEGVLGKTIYLEFFAFLRSCL